MTMRKIDIGTEYHNPGSRFNRGERKPNRVRETRTQTVSANEVVQEFIRVHMNDLDLMDMLETLTVDEMRADLGMIETETVETETQDLGIVYEESEPVEGPENLTGVKPVIGVRTLRTTCRIITERVRRGSMMIVRITREISERIRVRTESSFRPDIPLGYFWAA